MGPFKRYVTCIITFFISFICVTLCQFYSITYPGLFTKSSKLWKARKNNFWYIWLLTLSRHTKAGRISHLYKCIFKDKCIYKQLILTKHWNYGIISFLWNVRASWETKKERSSHRKKYIDEFVWGITFLAAYPRSYVIFFVFVAFFIYSLPLIKWRTCWIVPIKIHNSIT